MLFGWGKKGLRRRKVVSYKKGAALPNSHNKKTPEKSFFGKGDPSLGENFRGRREECESIINERRRINMERGESQKGRQIPHHIFGKKKSFSFHVGVCPPLSTAYPSENPTRGVYTLFSRGKEVEFKGKKFVGQNVIRATNKGKKKMYHQR